MLVGLRGHILWCGLLVCLLGIASQCQRLSCVGENGKAVTWYALLLFAKRESNKGGLLETATTSSLSSICKLSLCLMPFPQGVSACECKA